MIKVLAVVSLTAFLCSHGVQSAERSFGDLGERIIKSGTVVFLDFLEKFRNVTEKIVRDDQFRKTRITVQRLMKSLREFVKSMKNTENARGSQDNSAISPQRFFPLMAVSFGATIREVFDKFYFPYLNIYRQSFKNETVVKIWKEVESHYLPGAPPIYSKPMEFFSYLLAKAVVRSRMVNMLEAGVETVLEIGKIDFNQLHKDVQVVMDQIRKKAFEISVLERQKEKNDFLISLRTTSGLVVFYWDKFLEHIESPSFQANYLDSVKKCAELTEFRDTSEKYHVLLDPKTRHGFLKWAEHHFGEFFDALIMGYCSHGIEALGLERFIQSNWAIGKSAVVYSRPVCEKLSEVSFGVNEINRFLHRVNHIILNVEGNDELYARIQDSLERVIQMILQVLNQIIDEEKTKSKNNQLLLPLRVFRNVFIKIWSIFIILENYSFFNETKLQRSVNEWKHVERVVINELLKSETFTRKQLEEAPKNFIRAIHRILEKLKEYTDLFDGFDEKIDPTALVFKNSLHQTNIIFHEVWDILVE